MGLDLVEIVMALEDEFEIEITESAWSEKWSFAKGFTAGDIYEFVLQQVDKKKLETPCPNVKNFYRLRRTLTEVAGIERRQVKPEEEIAALLPLARRRKLWKKLGTRLDGRLPRLRRSPFVQKLGLALILGAGILALPLIVPLPALDALLAGMVCTTFLMLLFIPVFLLVTLPWARHVPARLTTVGDLVQGMRNPYIPELSAADEDVWPRIQKTLAQILKIDPEQVTPEARIIEDLGAG